MRWQAGGAFTMPLAHEARADQADADELRYEGATSLDVAHEYVAGLVRPEQL
jgi:hypothetical protein